MLDNVKMFARYVSGLRGFLRRPLTHDECYQRITQRLRSREASFLSVLKLGIYANPNSPYRKLLHHFGIEFEDVAKLIHQEGLRRALETLSKAGVYVTLDEFKGRKPIERSGLRINVRAQDFDNPLLTKHYEARTGGSRGVGTRLIIDFDMLTHDAAYLSFFLTTFDVEERPMGLWRPLPPGVAGMKTVLLHQKVGKPIERWFTQNPLVMRPGAFKYFIFTSYALYGSRLFGRPLPMPEHVSLEKASQVARWLAAKKRVGTPALLCTNSSSGVRVCLAAKEHGLDIAGTFFRLGGEPFTLAKAQVVADTGSRAVSKYSRAEVGRLGIPCAAPAALDEVHLLTDKVEVIQREKPVGPGGVRLDVLSYTTLLPMCPKLMLNVEVDDYGVLEERSCGCPWEALGFMQHLHTIRSHEKLTSEGMHFLGSELITLLEEVLPARFGGHPTDYQVLEEEEGGLPKVSLLVSPRVGPIDEEGVVATVLQGLRAFPGAKKMMADRWQEGQTLRVIRREPYATGVGKILPLHILGRG